MGEHQAITTAEWEISRESQDSLAAASHHNLSAAYDRGFFGDLVTPYLGVTRDQNLRPHTTVEKLATLPTVFGRGEGAAGTMTAGNSTPPSVDFRRWPASSMLRPPQSTMSMEARGC